MAIFGHFWSKWPKMAILAILAILAYFGQNRPKWAQNRPDPILAIFGHFWQNFVIFLSFFLKKVQKK